MKKVFIIITLIIAGKICNAQLLTPEVVASSGDYFSSSAASLSWTIGEPLIETYSGVKAILTQGFQQPSLTPVNVINLSDNINISVFPNPVGNNLSVNFSETTNGKYTINIYDITGRIVFSKEKDISNSNCNLVIPFNFSNGIYSLSIISPEQNINQSYRIIKNQ